jgi:hypothetical protein
MKKAILLALAFVLALSLAACGEKTDNTGSTGGNTSTSGTSSTAGNNGGSSVSWPSLDWVEDWMKKADVGTIVEIEVNANETAIFVTFENVSKDGYEAYVAYMAEKGEHRHDEEKSDDIQCTGINVSQISMTYEPFGEKETMDVTFYK